jgi:hypothetical protein
MQSKRLLTAAMIAAAAAAGHAQTSPYAGEQARDIKALSDQDIKELQSGHGKGLAKAAELNGYPGPAHVLELADELKLTPHSSGWPRNPFWHGTRRSRASWARHSSRPNGRSTTPSRATTSMNPDLSA